MVNCRQVIFVVLGLSAAGPGTRVAAHDVPDRAFDRTIQVTVEPDRVRVAYQLSLTQLTLAEELLALVGSGGLSGTGPTARMETYAQRMGPLLADGLLVRIDGAEQKFELVGVSQRIEDHVRLQFDFESPLVEAADERTLNLEDTNFFLEKGRVRVAIRAEPPAVLTRSSVPADVERVLVRASWEMSPAEQDAARRADAAWLVDPANRAAASGETGSELKRDSASHGDDLLALLDRWSDGVYVVLLGLAFFFGAAHAMTPGHGKTMVAAYLVGEHGTLGHAVGLGLTTSLTHTSSVLVVAFLLKLLGPAFEGRIHKSFALASGLLVAGLGACLLFVRLGGRLRRGADTNAVQACGHGGCRSDESNDSRESSPHGGPGWTGLITLGVSGGIVPCWDAVVLLLIAMAQGQVDRAVYLLLSFSAGLASTLVLVGVLAVKMRGYLAGRLGAGGVVQALPVFSAAAILAVGIYLCASTWHAAPGTSSLALPVANRMAAP